MSGNIYGGINASITLVIDLRVNCECCIQAFFTRLKDLEGAESVTIKGTDISKQLTVVQKLHNDKIRKSLNFSKPQKMTAVMGINLDCDGCIENTKKIISSTPGFQSMSTEMDKRLVTVTGEIALNALAEKLEKRLRKFVKIISIDVNYCSVIGCGGSNSVPKCRSPLTIEEILKCIHENFV